MKAFLLDINGKEKKLIKIPKEFSAKIREDLVQKSLKIKNNSQPYAPSPVAGKQHSASGKLVHRRHVWKSQYGRGMSRIPRKITSRKGSQFVWTGAEIPSVRGGKRAHPPKILSRINTKKINKKEQKIAFISALSATANLKKIEKKYATFKNEKIKLPLIIEAKITTLKTKDILLSIKKILGEKIFKIAVKKKSQRAGKGKLRGRKYKKTTGLLFVIGKKENLKTNAFTVIKTNKLGIENLAKGGVGRLTMYSEEAIKEIGEKFK